jgi:hypothetical protein
MYQDNMSAILLEKNGRKSAGKRSRHLNICYFFLTDIKEQGWLNIKYCPTVAWRLSYQAIAWDQNE